MSTIKTRDIRKSLTGKGFQVIECSHHEMLWLFAHGKKTSIRTRLSHGSDEYDDGLLGLMAKQLKLKRSELNSLIECPMSGDEYLNSLLQQGHVRLTN
jgi:hypothetical protein